MTHRRQFLAQAAALPAMALGLRPAGAQTQAWPATTRIVVPLPAGGAVDAGVRKLGEQLAKTLATTLVVDNKPGASGQLAAQAVVGAPADGSVLLYLHSGLLTAQVISGRMNLLRDFKPVSKVSSSPHLLVVAAGSPHKTQADLVAAMRATPGKLNFGSGGLGSPTHLMFERMDDLVPGGLKGTHVPFKGAIDAVVSVIGGDVDFVFAPPGAVIEHLKSGKLRALAVTSAVRMGQLPQVPTVAEAGLAGYRDEPWGGVVVPVKTPDEVVTRLFEALKQAANAADYQALLARVGGTVEVSASPAAFAKAMHDEIEANKVLVPRLGIKAE